MSRTLSVFEHGMLAVTASDSGLRRHEFEALVKFNDAHDGKYFEVGHDRVKAKHHVGYLEVGSLAIEILPKADRDAPGDKNVWKRGCSTC